MRENNLDALVVVRHGGAWELNGWWGHVISDVADTAGTSST